MRGLLCKRPAWQRMAKQALGGLRTEVRSSGLCCVASVAVACVLAGSWSLRLVAQSQRLCVIQNRKAADPGG